MIVRLLFLLSLIIAVGSMLGKIKVRGVSLGATFVLFVGLAVGHFYGSEVNNDLLDFIKDFGVVLFIYSIGLQVGPGFFSSFKKEGMMLNGLALFEVFLGVGVTIALFFFLNSFHSLHESGSFSMPMMVGVMSGAVTDTPGLGAATEALQQLQHSGAISEVPPISLGYAVAYPIAIVATIFAMMLVKWICRVKPEEEDKRLAELQNNSKNKPAILTFRITNRAIDGLMVSQMKQLYGHEAIATRLNDGEKIFIPHADTVLHFGDIILIVTDSEYAPLLEKLLGQKMSYIWKDDHDDLVSRRIVVTRGEINGKTIGQLHLRSALNVNITRINRAGMDLLARPDLVLQMGDRVMVVGPLENIRKAENMLGNTLKRLNDPHLVTIFLGIMFGIIAGSIPIHIPNLPMPARLGLAGGPLIVAILIGRFGYKLKLITYTTQSANLMLRELGLSLFLASIGLQAGGEFLQTVVSTDGLIFAASGLAITLLPALIVGLVARYLKLDFFTICGLIAGSHNNAPPLAYPNSLSDTDQASVTYSTVYPLVAFMRILIAQMMILLLYGLG